MKISQVIAILAVALPVAAGPALAASASDNWGTHCAMCHGPDGSGHTRMGRRLHLKDYTDPKVQAEMKDDAMFTAIKDGVKVDGRTRMKAYKDELSDAEIHDLVAYIRQMKK